MILYSIIICNLVNLVSFEIDEHSTFYPVRCEEINNAV